MNNVLIVELYIKRVREYNYYHKRGNISPIALLLYEMAIKMILKHTRNGTLEVLKKCCYFSVRIETQDGCPII